MFFNTLGHVVYQEWWWFALLLPMVVYPSARGPHVVYLIFAYGGEWYLEEWSPQYMAWSHDIHIMLSDYVLYIRARKGVVILMGERLPQYGAWSPDMLQFPTRRGMHPAQVSQLCRGRVSHHFYDGSVVSFVADQRNGVNSDTCV